MSFASGSELYRNLKKKRQVRLILVIEIGNESNLTCSPRIYTHPHGQGIAD